MGEFHRTVGDGAWGRGPSELEGVVAGLRGLVWDKEEQNAAVTGESFQT